MPRLSGSLASDILRGASSRPSRTAPRSRCSLHPPLRPEWAHNFTLALFYQPVALWSHL